MILRHEEPRGIRTANCCIKVRTGHDLKAICRAVYVDSVVSRVCDKSRVREFRRLLEEFGRDKKDCGLVAEQDSCLVYLLAKGNDSREERVRGKSSTSQEVGIRLAVKERVARRYKCCAVCRKRRSERATEDTESIVILSDTCLRSHISYDAGPYAVHIVIKHVLREFDTLSPVEDVDEHLVRHFRSIKRDGLSLTRLSVKTDALEYLVDFGSMGRILGLEKLARGRRCNTWLSRCIILEFLEENEVEFGADDGRVLCFSKDKVTIS